ncbi:MAG: RNA polymerase sigma factor, partial [Gemmatimonadaceae bacterium]
MDERALIIRVMSGDRIAARDLYDAHAPRIHRVVYRIVGDGDLAKELVQDTFVRAFAQLATFRGESALSTWLQRIAVRTTSNAMRKVRTLRKRETELDEAAPIAAIHRRADPDLRARLSSAIDTLPEKLRITLIMHDIEGYTHQEIADFLGV